MRVYIIRWFDGEPYSSYGGIHKVFDSLDKAETYLKETGTGPHDVDEEEYDCGYFLNETIQEFEVE